MLALFNIGGGEIILILAIVLILFGAKKLPELAKGLGQGIKEFKKATHNASEGMREAMAESPPTVPRRLSQPQSSLLTPIRCYTRSGQPNNLILPWCHSNSETTIP